MGKVIGGSLLSLVFIAVGVYVFLSSGRLNVAATTPPDTIDELAEFALDRALERQAAGTTVSIPKDAAGLERGLPHFRENCLPCHGAPGIPAFEFAQGMNPSVPLLDSDHVQKLSDGQIFWIVKNGIRFTGMPAFGVNHADSELADIVAFVRHLPKLDPAETEKLKAALPEPHHHAPPAAAEDHSTHRHNH
jgi:mono/diheme cytochrome c family protein